MTTVIEQVRERPILFSGPMVRAILEGRKTQTRRVVKMSNSQGFPRKLWAQLDFTNAFPDGGPSPAGNPGPYLHVLRRDPTVPDDPGWHTRHRIYPKWFVGDRLWVRETYLSGSFSIDPSGEYKSIGYAADGGLGPWRSPMFMPRSASRLTLEITEIRVQRVQEIREEDAGAEGIYRYDNLCSSMAGGQHIEYGYHYEYGMARGVQSSTAADAFLRLWNSINAKPKPVKGADGLVSHYASYPFEDVQEVRQHRDKPWYVIGNPWVWALTFRRVDS
jgi:hypothetical protein